MKQDHGTFNVFRHTGSTLGYNVIQAGTFTGKVWWKKDMEEVVAMSGVWKDAPDGLSFSRLKVDEKSNSSGKVGCLFIEDHD